MGLKVWVTNFNEIIRVGVTKKGTFNQILERGENAGHLDIADTSLQHKGTAGAKT